MEPTDPRQERRSNVLLSAVLSFASGAIPVRIRNLAPLGALVDGQNLPASGSVILRRGGFFASAQIAWAGDGECGLRFETAVEVKEWVKRVPHPGQQRVDTIVAALKAGAIPHSPVETPGPSLVEITQELQAVTRQLAMLPNMTTELAEQILKLEALGRDLEDHASRSPASGALHSLR